MIEYIILNYILSSWRPVPEAGREATTRIWTKKRRRPPVTHSAVSGGRRRFLRPKTGAFIDPTPGAAKARPENTLELYAVASSTLSPSKNRAPITAYFPPPFLGH